MHHCYHCGREITGSQKSIGIIVVEQAGGRLGSALLHHHCTEPSLSRYRQTIQWAGQLGNIETFKTLHRHLAAHNKASYGAVPILLA